MSHFDADLDTALRTAPEVHVPCNFRQRVIAQLPDAPPAERPQNWQLPTLAGLVALLLGALALAGLELGLARWFRQPAIFLGFLGIGTAVALLWLYRLVFSR